jgi:hypothetical protein
MFRFAAVLLLLAGSLLATSFTATTTSQGGAPCSKINQPDPVTCSGGSFSPTASAEIKAFAGYLPGLGAMAIARLDLDAICLGSVLNCLTQSGFADAEVDLAIHGPAGATALVEFSKITINVGGLAATSLAVTGVNLVNPIGLHGGSIYSFTYEAPIHLSATIQGGCSECGDPISPLRLSAFISAPFYLYDLNMNPLGTIESPLDALPAATPEPGTAAALSAGFLLLVALRNRRLLLR